MPVAAVTYSAVSFFTSTGRQLSIPGSALSVGDDGQLSVAADYAEASAWLNHLFASGAIRAGTTPPAETALEFRAADAGSLGNEIQIVVSDGATESSYDIQVTVVSDYTGLTVDNAKSVLGTPSSAGSQRGLLLIATGGTLAMPKDGFSSNLSGGSDSPLTAGQADVLQADDTTAFIVVSSKPGLASNDIVVTVTAAADSFDLKAQWQRTLTAVTASDLALLSSTFGFFLTFSAPPGPSRLPESGEYHLHGGVDSVAASTAAVAREV